MHFSVMSFTKRNRDNRAKDVQKWFRKKEKKKKEKALIGYGN